MALREKDRLIQAYLKSEVQTQTLAKALGKLEHHNLQAAIGMYYKACVAKYTGVFFAWRDQIQKLMDTNHMDLNDGYSYPFLQNRVVENFE